MAPPSQESEPPANPGDSGRLCGREGMAFKDIRARNGLTVRRSFLIRTLPSLTASAANRPDPAYRNQGTIYLFFIFEHRRPWAGGPSWEGPV